MKLVSSGTVVDPTKCYTAGWFVVNLSKLYPKILQYIQLPFICTTEGFQRCINAWANKQLDAFVVDVDTDICAGYYGDPANPTAMYRGPCNGDRGAILQCETDAGERVGVGILIQANDCINNRLENKIPAIFLNIYNYLDFIQQTIDDYTD